MKLKLNEDFTIYVDDETGDEYISPDGKTLIKVKSGTKEIGSKGSEDIQRAEEEERNRQAAQEEGSVIETEEELKARLKEIEIALNDTENSEKVSGEARAKVERENLKKEQARVEAELKRFRDENPILPFKDSLNVFIRKQVQRATKDTYARLNKRYDGTEFIKKGRKKYDKQDVPSVRVYFDRSGSWDEEKTKVGREAIATLDKYVRAKQLKVDIHYFNTEVFDTYTPSGSGGTRGTPILANIISTRPDNVIVMTDADIRDCKEYVQVPGVVWYLFKGGVSDNLMEHLTGKIATKAFEL